MRDLARRKDHLDWAAAVVANCPKFNAALEALRGSAGRGEKKVGGVRVKKEGGSFFGDLPAFKVSVKSRLAQPDPKFTCKILFQNLFAT